MGGRKLPHPGTLAALLLVALLAVTCARSGAPRQEPTPSAPATAASQPPASPTPSPTPDPLGPPPPDLAAARAAIDRLEATIGICAPIAAERWGIRCVTGDIDGDLRPDTAILFPLDQPAPVAPHPGVVFVHLTTAPAYLALSPPGAADTSIIGQSVFAIADRDGRPRPEVSFLENLCTATRCSSLVRVYAWDGTAWRDIGPADDGITALVRVAFEGEGAATAIVMQNQPVASPAAGPIRGGTYRYTLAEGRFTRREARLDPPEYLFHAILDADALFARGLWREAIAAYESAINDTTLRDWRDEIGRGPSRDALAAYALFRIAVAEAASGADPNPALDRLIREGREPVFLNAAEAFRKGYQERGSAGGGCLEATRYLATTGPGIDTPAYVQRLLDHGYANPQYTYRDICPL